MSMKNGGETRAAVATEPKIPCTTKPQFPPGKVRLIVESSPECVQGFNKARSNTILPLSTLVSAQ